MENYYNGNTSNLASWLSSFLACPILASSLSACTRLVGRRKEEEEEEEARAGSPSQRPPPASLPLLYNNSPSSFHAYDDDDNDVGCSGFLTD